MRLQSSKCEGWANTGFTSTFDAGTDTTLLHLYAINPSLSGGTIAADAGAHDNQEYLSRCHTLMGRPFGLFDDQGLYTGTKHPESSG